jgi:type II secretory pathway pseudopilin PulG
VPSRWPDDRGKTLIELLVAIIMGIAVGGLLASVKFSDVHRKQATSGGLARDYAELIDRHVAGSGYAACAGPAAYSPTAVGYTLPADYDDNTAGVTTVRYWTAAGTWAATCSSDFGLQQVTVQVASPDGRATEQFVLVVRKPCGQGSSC